MADLRPGRLMGLEISTCPQSPSAEAMAPTTPATTLTTAASSSRLR
jgi:hypothetical protein